LFTWMIITTCFKKRRPGWWLSTWAIIQLSRKRF